MYQHQISSNFRYHTSSQFFLTTHLSTNCAMVKSGPRDEMMNLLKVLIVYHCVYYIASLNLFEYHTLREWFSPPIFPWTIHRSFIMCILSWWGFPIPIPVSLERSSLSIHLVGLAFDLCIAGVCYFSVSGDLPTSCLYSLDQWVVCVALINALFEQEHGMIEV